MRDDKYRLPGEPPVDVQLERYRNLARISTDWFWETDADYTIIYMSESVERITGFSRDTYVGMSRYDLASEETKKSEAWKRHCDAIARREPVKNFEYKHVGTNGHTVYLRVNAVPLFNDDGTFRGYLGSTTDISELVMATRKLEEVNHKLLIRTQELEESKLEAEQLARTDALTGLRNRRAFFDDAHAIDGLARRYAHVYSVIMLDVDHFKNVNDAHGHDVGDQALKTVAATLTEASRDSDIAGRIGGEEFAVLLPQTAGDSAKILAERLRASIADGRIGLPSGSLSITASLGVAQCDPEQKDGFQAVIKRADEALYEAKRMGRNKVVVADA